MKYFDPSTSSLRLILEIISTGKLTTAASRLGMSQSAASHALKVFESQVGAALFLRKSEGLHLSETGQRLLPRIEQVVSHLDAIHKEVSGLSELKTGNLRVAAVPSILGTILPPILREYANRYPGVELTVFEGTDDEVRTWILSGVAHVGFAGLPLDGVPGEEVARDEWLALVPVRAFPGRSSITLRELGRQKFLMSGGGCEGHIHRLFASARVKIPDYLTVKQLPTIQAMVAEELGVSLTPALSIRSTHPGSRTLPLKPRQFRQIGLLRPTAGAFTPALEAWMALTRSWFQKSGLQDRVEAHAPKRVKSST
jgi:DNA-binding transcriptional LysR family regulator